MSKSLSGDRQSANRTATNVMSRLLTISFARRRSLMRCAANLPTAPGNSGPDLDGERLSGPQLPVRARHTADDIEATGHLSARQVHPVPDERLDLLLIRR